MKPLAALAAALLLGACAGPDLIIDGEPTVDWNLPNDKAEVSFIVKNQGTDAAGEFLVYVDGVESPESTNRRPQVSKKIAGLAAGASTTVTGSFIPLKHPDNGDLSRVYRLKFILDPKEQVSEKDEGNNEKVRDVP